MVEQQNLRSVFSKRLHLHRMAKQTDVSNTIFAKIRRLNKDII